MDGRKWICGRAGWLLFITVLLPVSAWTQDRSSDAADDSDHLWNAERPNIEKLAQFTARQGGAILFTIDRAVGLTEKGTVRRVELPRTNSHCPIWSAALSHDGHSLAFESSPQSGHCIISIYDLATGAIRHLLDLPYAPWALTWSWDDTKIAFSDPSNLYPAIQAVSVHDGSVSTIVESSRLATERTQAGVLLRIDGLASMQWSRAGDELLVGFRRETPTAQPNTYTSYPVEYRIELANHDRILEIGDGDGASFAVRRSSGMVPGRQDRRCKLRRNKSPGYYWRASMDGTFAGRLQGAACWSPDGRQLFFGMFTSETCRDDVYLLRVDTRRSRRFLHRTCITTTDWR